VALRRFAAVLVGGAATDAALLARARAEGVAVVTTYGMTETAGGCVYGGRPLDGVLVRVGPSGIELAGPTLALGYRLDPDGTAAAFAGGWFRTRDAGALADGVLQVHGRIDDVVISGGVNVAPAAVEAALREHPDVADAVVFGRPDPEWGQQVVAAVVPAPGAVPALAALRPWVAERLGPAAAPRQLHTVEAVPTLHTGKPDRRRLIAALFPGDR
jgi:O-succinylbenzoic acid--CoA ligase